MSMATSRAGTPRISPKERSPWSPTRSLSTEKAGERAAILLLTFHPEAPPLAAPHLRLSGQSLMGSRETGSLHARRRCAWRLRLILLLLLVGLLRTGSRAAYFRTGFGETPSPQSSPSGGYPAQPSPPSYAGSRSASCTCRDHHRLWRRRAVRPQLHRLRTWAAGLCHERRRRATSSCRRAPPAAGRAEANHDGARLRRSPHDAWRSGRPLNDSLARENDAESPRRIGQTHTVSPELLPHHRSAGVLDGLCLSRCER